jgi:hypothetical protein
MFETTCLASERSLSKDNVVQVFSSRLRRVVGRHGLLGTLSLATSRLWNRVAHHEQLVFEWPIEVARTYRSGGLQQTSVAIFQTRAEVPNAIVEHIVKHEGGWFIQQMDAVFPRGANLVVVICDGLPASFLWARRAENLAVWYVPLNPSDNVLFGWHTTPSKRGQGLIGVALQATVQHFESQTTRFLADVKAWNTPSIRSMQKAGFRLVAKSKPLSDRVQES